MCFARVFKKINCAIFYGINVQIFIIREVLV